MELTIEEIEKELEKFADRSHPSKFIDMASFADVHVPLLIARVRDLESTLAKSEERVRGINLLNTSLMEENRNPSRFDSCPSRQSHGIDNGDHPMNIRYRFRKNSTGEILESIYSLDEIEIGVLRLWVGYEILSRDIGTGELNCHGGSELFERDRVIWRILDRPEGIITFSQGAFWVQFSKDGGDRLLLANCSGEYFEIIGRSEE